LGRHGPHAGILRLLSAGASLAALQHAWRPPLRGHGAGKHAEEDQGAALLCAAAARRGRADVVDWLLREAPAVAAAVDGGGGNVLHAAAGAGESAVLSTVAKALPAGVLAGLLATRTADEEGLTPLAVAVLGRRESAVRQLLHFGADPNTLTGTVIRPTSLMPLLARAALAGLQAMVSLLVDAGANVDAASGRGLTALALCARQRGASHMVTHLAGLGANPNTSAR